MVRWNRTYLIFGVDFAEDSPRRVANSTSNKVFAVRVEKLKQLVTDGGWPRES